MIQIRHRIAHAVLSIFSVIFLIATVPAWAEEAKDPCDPAKQESLPGLYKLAVECGGPEIQIALKAREGTINWLPNKTRLTVTLKDKAEGKRLSAYWMKLKTTQSALEATVEPTVKPTAEDFEVAEIFGQTIVGDTRVLELSSPKYEGASPMGYSLMLVGKPSDTVDGWTMVALTDQVVVSRVWAWIVCTVLLLIALIILLVGVNRQNRFLSGPGGRLSLASTQIFFFTVIVISIATWVFLRTGTLGEISQDVLLLVGITGVGASAAKVGDRFTQRLDWSNWLWLVRQGWLEEKPSYKVVHLIQDSAGEFDVFRVQAVAFSLIVAGVLVTNGLAGLGEVDLPDAIMVLLGLSQATYVSGKAVRPPSFSDFDTQLTNYRSELGKKGASDSDVQTLREKLVEAFEAVFGKPAKPTIHPRSAGLEITFDASTRDLFPIEVAVAGNLLATLPVFQTTYRNLHLSPSTQPVQVVLTRTDEVTTAANRGPCQKHVGPLTEGQLATLAVKSSDF